MTPLWNITFLRCLGIFRGVSDVLANTLIQQPPIIYHLHSLEPGALPLAPSSPSRIRPCSASLVTSTGFCWWSGRPLGHLTGPAGTPSSLQTLLVFHREAQPLLCSHRHGSFYWPQPCSACRSHQAPPHRHWRKMLLFLLASVLTERVSVSLQWNNTLPFYIQSSLSWGPRHPLRGPVRMS